MRSKVSSEKACISRGDKLSRRAFAKLDPESRGMYQRMQHMLEDMSSTLLEAKHCGKSDPPFSSMS
jgi:hypothetical protein